MKTLLTGLPHPLAKFALDGSFVDGIAAQMLVDYIAGATMLESDSARWLLLESEQTFFLCCEEAGVDAVLLRAHLRMALR